MPSTPRSRSPQPSPSTPMHAGPAHPVSPRDTRYTAHSSALLGKEVTPGGLRWAAYGDAHARRERGLGNRGPAPGRRITRLAHGNIARGRVGKGLGFRIRNSILTVVRSCAVLRLRGVGSFRPPIPSVARSSIRQQDACPRWGYTRKWPIGGRAHGSEGRVVVITIAVLSCKRHARVSWVPEPRRPRPVIDNHCRSLPQTSQVRRQAHMPVKSNSHIIFARCGP